jgi:lysophospholipid acyltransferase (LPLAT)-like uncharacterized protein
MCAVIQSNASHSFQDWHDVFAITGIYYKSKKHNCPYILVSMHADHLRAYNLLDAHRLQVIQHIS